MDDIIEDWKREYRSGKGKDEHFWNWVRQLSKGVLLDIIFSGSGKPKLSEDVAVNNLREAYFEEYPDAESDDAESGEWWVVVFEKTQEYGGPEEGGWYYYDEQPILEASHAHAGRYASERELSQGVMSIPAPQRFNTRREAEEWLQKSGLEDTYRKYNQSHRMSDVANWSNYTVKILDYKPTIQPRSRPHYE